MASSRLTKKRGRKPVSASKATSASRSGKQDLNHIKRRLLELRREIRASFQ